jgi:hypothetical protein
MIERQSFLGRHQMTVIVEDVFCLGSTHHSPRIVAVSIVISRVRCAPNEAQLFKSGVFNAQLPATELVPPGWSQGNS